MRSVSAVGAPILGMLAAGIAVITLINRTFGTEVAMLANLAHMTINAV